MKFVLFTDNLSDWTIRQACQAAKGAGFDGLDLTVRPGGHVLPEDAVDGFPAAQAVADQESIEIPMISTAITDAESPHAASIIDAAHHRIRDIKLGYWRYQPFGTLIRQVDNARRRLEGIVRLCKRFGVRPCVHIHSGPILSNGPLLYMILKDFSPEEVGAYVDPMHMTLEGGSSGWEMALDILAPWIALVGVKNFAFEPAGRDPFGQRQFDWRYTPLSEGAARLPEFFRRLKQLNYNGVVSLHSEYKGERSFLRMNSDELIEQSRKDLQYLKGVIHQL